MTALLLLVALQQQPDPVPYSGISSRHQLSGADRLMREGKYLEAAVAYRNALLQPGDREAVRIPFALALFAHGDTNYAGLELRRAQTLFDGFDGFELDVTELFASRAELARLAEKAARGRADGDGAETQAALAWILHLLGEHDAATAALGRYAQMRGEDAYARAMKARIARGAGKRPAAPAEPPSSRRVEPARAAIRPGEPVRAGIRYIESLPRPRDEILER